MTFSYSELFNKAWADIKDQLPLVAGLTLVYFVGICVIASIPVVGSFLSGPFTAGYMVCLLKIRSRQEIGYADVFWGFMNFNRFLQLILSGFLVGLLTVAGLVLLIIPGIWFGIASVLTTAYIVLDDTDAITAIKKSLDAVKGNWWPVFGLLILFALLGIAGALFLLIGLLFATPLITTATLRLAETLNPEGQKDQRPPSSGGPSVLNVNPY